ncbi:RdgB/HAM1 family non-canonical purine NTP pyrophosphatase [Bermanella marisrubri]|uniref:dITP/XTP pyrophosphatase n=1 Tax=Bermanella marisrubri TaxID=207949 RepID=Q1N432_9GAMM|nr:RdgB/HAM1 family non-canonical purine NTP pyrophosphatase [Bermanella marisrubri]EAT13033.1 putative deoxyribonucleotide triphosphate pyrophosphatase [Oceanobacter sp. RED65] [Bermanella marisrubri]QIZ82844.1 RdgB/HAM1 family non-canonical purine NTP pyrophosphatase [Bermanella marisrubri]
MSKQTIVLASGNKGKLAELQNALDGFDVELVPQKEFDVTDVDETGLSFIENAILKARHASLATGLPALADDSGLEVDALDGEPGIYSARYSQLDPVFSESDDKDENNNLKLLKQLKHVQPENRSARFHCVLAFVRHAKDPNPLICQGSWEGQIEIEISGDGGFGYDPLFFVKEENCTAAQLSKEKKNEISHRGKAIAQLKQVFRL